MSPPETLRTTSTTRKDQLLTDLLADVAEVFNHRIDSDGVLVLLHACLEVTDADGGAVHLEDVAGRLTTFALDWLTGADDSATVPTRESVLRCMVSLRDESSRLHDESLSVAFPLRARGRSIGAVELHVSRGGSIEPAARNAVQSLSDVAAVTIEHARTIDQTSRLVGQLQTALDHRVVLEQAKGMLAERLGVDCHTAFREIRAVARREQKPITDIASAIVKGRDRHTRPA